MKQPDTYARAKEKSINYFLWLCHCIWLFHLSNILENTYFFPIFSLADFMILGMLLIAPLEVQEIKHQLFSMTQPFP